jgi:hypothetical protein
LTAESSLRAGSVRHAPIHSFKLAVEDFQCAASLVQKFQSTREPEDPTAQALGVSADAAHLAYVTFANNFQHMATALARGQALRLEEAADLKVENEKAAEWLFMPPQPLRFHSQAPRETPGRL